MKDWYVVATDEDGNVYLYGPYKMKKAQRVAEDVLIQGMAHDMDTDILQARKKVRKA